MELADQWTGEDWRSITPYLASPKAFHSDMQRLADDLEAAGL